MALSDLLQGYNLWYNHDITRMLQDRSHKVVTILLSHDCIGLVGTILLQVW
jgi:hypothetical protein